MDANPKSWLILTQYFPPEVGAPQLRLLNISRELQRRGFRVRVVTAMPNYPTGRAFEGYRNRWSLNESIEGIQVHRAWIWPGAGRSRFIRFANYLSFTITAIPRVLLGPPCDVLFVEAQPLSLGLVALLMKWARGTPFIFNVPDLQIEVASELGFIRNNMVLRLARRLEDLCLREAWKVSVVTRKFAEHFRRRGVPEVKITFLPNGADSKFLRPVTPSIQLLDRWRLHGKRVILYVGTHAYYHGLDTLIRSAEMLKMRTDLVFLLIGDGPEREGIKASVRQLGLQNVVFGVSPYREMPNLYSIAYLSVATLRNIETARQMRLSKIFPSLSCAVPVIYSGVGEAAELLREENCGVEVEPENPGALADAICFLSDRPTLRDEMGRRGRALVVREYDWAKIISMWLTEIGCQP